MAASSSAHRPIKLVLGYLRHDFIPYGARNVGLIRRIAFVTDSFRPGDVDQYFDAPLYADLVIAIQRALQADRVQGGFRFDKTVEFQSADDVRRHASDAGEPLSTVAFFRGAQMIAMAVSEPYAYVGGPEPYRRPSRSRPPPLPHGIAATGCPYGS